MGKHQDRRLTFWQNFIAGGIAGVGSRTFTSPLDVVKIMSPVIDEWFITGLPGPRGADSQTLSRVMLEAGVEVDKMHVCDGVDQALNSARQAAAIADTIIIFGSFVTVTAALPHI